MRPIKYRAIFDGKIETNMSLEGMFAHYENGSCQLEQFTGIHDRNGIPIFEGDILKQDDYRHLSPIVSIKWDDEEACFYPFNTGYPDYSNFEIIGNIHENPELLETK